MTEPIDEVVMRSWIAAAGLVLALGGCAEVPQSHGYELLSAELDGQSQYVSYISELQSDDIALLRGKVNFREAYRRGGSPCQGLRAPTAYPTPEESVALRRWSAVRAAFFEQVDALELKTAETSDTVAPLARLYVAALEDELDYSTALIDGLAAGKMTYCQFATRQKEAILASHDQVALLRRNMVTAMIDDYYFDGTGLARHPGLVKGGPYSNPGAYGVLPGGDSPGKN
jgi:hypothetical protein